MPLRSCVVSREKLPKRELLRIVKDNTGKIFVDKTGKANGRGAYIKKDIEVLKKAKLGKQLNRHLEINIPDDIYNEIEVIISEEQA
jgi:uncharacterized protein